MAIEKQILLKRLSFIKYLYIVATEQSDKPEPLCNASLLTFHDAVELFLQLACEHHNVVTNKSDFIGYFTLLEKHVSITQKETMRRFNNARVSIKHHGTMIAKDELYTYKISCQNFFVENIMTVFDIDFESISIIEIVTYRKAKEHLILAESKIQAKEYIEAINEITLAFWEMIAEYKEGKKEKYGKMPMYFFSRNLSLYSRSNRLLTGDDIEGLTQYVTESLDSIEKILNILTLGINYQKFTKFDLLTPYYTRTFGGGVLNNSHTIEYNADNVKWCFDFVIECCIGLQEFDYKI